jgi:hypothetical protein
LAFRQSKRTGRNGTAAASKITGPADNSKLRRPIPQQFRDPLLGIASTIQACIEIDELFGDIFAPLDGTQT